jgi:hypothetical protein
MQRTYALVSYSGGKNYWTNFLYWFERIVWVFKISFIVLVPNHMTNFMLL